MKTFAIAMTLGLFCIVCKGQDSNLQPNQGQPLTSITNWNDMALLFVSDFFNQSKDTIIAQIGNSEYEKVVKFGNVLAWPEPMQYKPGFRKDTTGKRIYYQKLGRLKMYKIASWQQHYNNQRLERYVILRIPYKENANWDKNTKWDTVYFIVKEKSTEEL